jgi:xanthine/uracil permease
MITGKKFGIRTTRIITEEVGNRQVRDNYLANGLTAGTFMALILYNLFQRTDEFYTS